MKQFFNLRLLGELLYFLIISIFFFVLSLISFVVSVVLFLVSIGFIISPLLYVITPINNVSIGIDAMYEKILVFILGICLFFLLPVTMKLFRRMLGGFISFVKIEKMIK